MSALEKIAVVINGAEGLGYEIVKKLCIKYPGKVYLTTSNIEDGKAAVERLEKLGLTAHSVYMDITRHDSIMVLMKRIRYTEGGVHLLVNNVDIKFEKPYEESLSNIASKTLKINYEGLKDLTYEMFYIMRRGSQVLNISSEAGYISNIPSMEIREKLSNSELTLSELDLLVEQYKDSATRGTCIEDGWGDDPYIVSKVFVTALSSAHQRYMDSLEPDVAVNCINAEYSMLDTQKAKTNEEKAEMIVAAGMNIPDNMRGSLIV